MSDTETHFVAETTGGPEALHPLTTARQHEQFITYRLHGFARNPFGLHSHGRVDHRRFRTAAARLVEGRFGYWEELGIIDPAETLAPYSVPTEPHIRFILMPPRPFRL